MTALISFIGPTALLAAFVVGMWNHTRDKAWPKAATTAAVPVALGLLGASVFTMAGPALLGAAQLAIAAGTLLVVLRTTVPTPVIPFAAALLGALLLRP